MRCRGSVILCLLLSLTLVLSGCEYKDIDKRFFVVSIGIDKPESGDARYKISLKLAIPSGTPKMGTSTFQVFTMESDTITEAVQRIKAKVDKELDFGHTKGIIFGEDLMKSDYREALDWMERQRFIQRIAWVGVGKPSAEAVQLVKVKSERLPSNALFLSFGQTGVESQYIISQFLFEFYRASKERGMSPVLPCIEAHDDYFRIDQAGVFNDRRLVMSLSPEETKLLNVMMERITKSDWKTRVKDSSYLVHADAIKVHTTLNTTTKKPTVRVDFRLDGIVEERTQAVRVTEPVMQSIRKNLAEQIQTKATDLLEKLQNERLDPIGIGIQYRSSHWDNHQEEWENWSKMYPKVKFQVTAKVDLRGSGIIE